MKLRLTPPTTSSATTTPPPKKTMLKVATGGGEDPKKKKVYQTQEEVNAANDLAKSIAARQNLVIAKDAYVARNPGDPVVEFNTPDGKPYVAKQYPKQFLQKTVPDEVTELHWDGNWQQPFYYDPQSGDIKYVERHWYNSKRFLKPIKESK